MNGIVLPTSTGAETANPRLNHPGHMQKGSAERHIASAGHRSSDSQLIGKVTEEIAIKSD